MLTLGFSISIVSDAYAALQTSRPSFGLGSVTFFFFSFPLPYFSRKTQTPHIIHCPIMPASYPADRSTCMSKEGPADPRFRILGGVLQYHPERDGRFPYLYRIPTHALVHSPHHIKTILIRIVNTSVEARIRCAQFDKTLSVPLGPNALMDKYGTLSDIRSPYFLTILFRSVGTETWHNFICPTLTGRWHLSGRRRHR